MENIKNDDIAFTKTRYVSCDGSDDKTGHPKIYLEISPHNSAGEIICPYCSKKFLLKNE